MVVACCKYVHNFQMVSKNCTRFCGKVGHESKASRLNIHDDRQKGGCGGGSGLELPNLFTHCRHSLKLLVTGCCWRHHCTPQCSFVINDPLSSFLKRFVVDSCESHHWSHQRVPPRSYVNLLLFINNVTVCTHFLTPCCSCCFIFIFLFLFYLFI